MAMILRIKGQLPSCPIAQVACHLLSTLSLLAEPGRLPFLETLGVAGSSCPLLVSQRLWDEACQLALSLT